MWSAGGKKLIAVSSLALVVAASALILVTPKQSSAFSGNGLGTYGHPYLITTCTELQNIIQDTQDKYSLFWLANDVDCTATASWNSGKGFSPIKDFEGTFDGRGHTITNFHINRPDEDNVGLFETLKSASRIYNLTIGANSTIVGRDAVGSLVGYFQYSKASGINSEATVEGHDNVGGLAGQLYGYNEARIEKSSYTGNVTSQGYAGGIVGIAMNGYTIENVLVNGNISGVIAGGIAGLSSQSCGFRYINNAAALGAVTGSTYSGGLVGFYNQQTCNETQINHSLASVTQAGAGTNGGVVGHADTSNVAITDTYFSNAHSVTDCVGSLQSSSIPDTECTGGADRTYATDAPYTNWNTSTV